MKPVSRAILILLCLILLLSFAACASSDGIPKEAKKLFSIWAVQWENTKPNSQGKAVVYTNWSFVLLRDEQYIIARSIASVPRVFRDTFDIEPYIPTDGTMLPNFYD